MVQLTQRPASHAAAVLPEYGPLPRSVGRRNAFLLLDGDWRFELDLDDRGVADRWFLGHDYAGWTRWPGSIESQLAHAEAMARPDPNLDQVVAWYERDIEIPREWLRPDTDVQVTFGACDYETRVWLDGHPLRTVEGDETHLGGYTSFSYELPKELLHDAARLTVRIADSLDPETPRGKQESRVFKRGGIWYQTISGPVRSIWVEPVERNRLRSRLGVVSTVADRLVELRMTTHIHEAGTYRLDAVVREQQARGRMLAKATMELPLEPGDARQHVVLHLPDARPWSPETPVLYGVEAQLTAPSGSVSRIETSFGLREVEARGRSFYLNGEPLYLDGVLYQPSDWSFDVVRQHLIRMKELGCNLVRVHIAGIDPRVYRLADEIGLLLWVEVPSPHRSSARSREHHEAELERMLPLIGAHPSVVMLSLFNESWGIEDVGISSETRAYLSRAYRRLRVEEPQLLVIDNDGWQHVSVEGRLQSDLLTAHVYTDRISRWRRALDRLVLGRLAGTTLHPLTVGDPYLYTGQAPLIVSEWGGFGFGQYGGPATLDARAKRIREFKRDLRRLPIAGDVYTQAVSVEDEVNGLIDPVTSELLVPEGSLRSVPSPEARDAARDRDAVDEPDAADGVPRPELSVLPGGVG